ncbi:serine/threonine protein kinase [Sandaracinus amylolyticus]|uniref:Serine/threonine protein kinase n=1 Tax=Sandaracinus amylolyticus TaxID=927083 RepID=A0A0F6W975_9BACT|nr:serine/threonine protein kinase [Sandaracinus amylolyticus]
MLAVVAGIGSVLGGRWELVAPVGGGGMGTVWRARDRQGGDDVAVKLMAKHVRGLASFEERFSREAIACESVRHPNVVSVLGHGTTDENEPYLVLELLEGESLGWRIERTPPPMAREAIGWIVDALAGLEAVHAAGIVHRDLKPDNLFLANAPGGRTRVKLLDFGISRMTAAPPMGRAAQWDSLTRSGEMLGTPVYMAPEQGTNAHHVDHRADLFSVGAILYETLAGRAPFEGANVGEILLAVSADDPEPLHERVPAIGSEVSAVVARALAKSPDDRWPDARAMREALEIALRSVPADASCGFVIGSARMPQIHPQRARDEESKKTVRSEPPPGGRELPEDAGEVFGTETDRPPPSRRTMLAVALAMLGALAIFVAYVVLGGDP